MTIIETKEQYESVLKENELVLVDFYADWCGPCKMVSPVLEELANDHPEVTFVKVNVDNLSDIAQQYGIMSIPTVIVFKNGELAKQTLGVQPKESFEALINEAK